MKKLFSLLILFSLLMIACEKDSVEFTQEKEKITEFKSIEDVLKSVDPELIDFFTYEFVEIQISDRNSIINTRSLDGLIEKIMVEIANQGKDASVAKKLYKKYGYLAWSLAYSGQLEDNENEIGYVFIPFSQGKNKNKATLAVRVTDEPFEYHILNKQKLKDIVKKGEMENGIISNAFLHTISDIKLKNKVDEELYKFYIKNKRKTLKVREVLVVVVCEAVCEEQIYFPAWENGDCVNWTMECNSTSIYIPGTDTYPDYDNNWENGGGGSSNNGPTTEELQLQELEMKRISKELGFSFGSPDWDYFEEHHLVRKVADGYLAGVNSAEDLYNTSEALIIDPARVAEFATNYATFKYLKQQNVSPYKNWSTFKIWWEASKSVAPSSEDIHTGLDVLGLLPVVGEAFDLVNAGFYTIEGDGINASISLAAIVPFWGSTATISRLYRKVIRTVDGKKLTLYLYKDYDGLWKFTNGKAVDYTNARNQLRKNLGIPSGSGTEAHHIIPWEHRDLPLVQKAAESGRFHMNAKGNGFDLDLVRHKDAHSSYNDLLLNEMDDIFDASMTPDDALQALVDIQNSVRSQLDSGKSLSQIVL